MNRSLSTAPHLVELRYVRAVGCPNKRLHRRLQVLGTLRLRREEAGALVVIMVVAVWWAGLVNEAGAVRVPHTISRARR